MMRAQVAMITRMRPNTSRSCSLEHSPSKSYLTVERTYDQVPPFLAGLLNTPGFFMALSLHNRVDDAT